MGGDDFRGSLLASTGPALVRSLGETPLNGRRLCAHERAGALPAAAGRHRRSHRRPRDIYTGYDFYSSGGHPGAPEGSYAQRRHPR